MRDCPKVGWYLPILAGIFVSIVFPATYAIGQISLSLEANAATAKTPQDTKTLQNKSAVPAAGQPKLPACPDAGLPTLKPSSNTEHHTVRLSWNASAPPHSSFKVLGYCLYRSQTSHVAQKNPTCKQCEQINSTAVPGTSCVDNLVQDSVTYYYVVTAAYGEKKITGSSNEATAKIPPYDPRAQPVSADSHPPCRTEVSPTPQPIARP